MLSPEDAKKQLEEWLVPRDDDGDLAGVERFLPAVTKLPKKLREAGYSLLGRNARGDVASSILDIISDDAAFQSQQELVIEGLSKAERLRLFGCFFGPLTEGMELAWHWMKSAPYSSGYSRTPFRAANSPELTLDQRAEWVRDMLPRSAAVRTEVLTPAWLAAWVPHLHIGWRWHRHGTTMLFAAVIDAGGQQSDEVFETLRASAMREHEIGEMGRHVTGALLSASRPEGWELIEKILLAAQRQEGLRQVILESLVDAHPEAFRRMLRLIVDEKLSRFSSVVQAMDDWFGMAWTAASTKKVNDAIEIVARMLEEPTARKKVLAGDDAEDVYLALWSIALEDAVLSITSAERLLDHGKIEVRYVAALHLARLRHTASVSARVKAFDDDGLRVALCALSGSESYYDGIEFEKLTDSSNHFAAVERLFERMPPKSTSLEPLVWPWTEQTADRDYVASQMISSLENLPPTLLIRHLGQLGVQGRAATVCRLGDQKKWNIQTRDTMLRLVGDPSPDVRTGALSALSSQGIQPDDAERLEAYLTRKSADLRLALVSRMLSLSDEHVLVSASRLLESKNQNQRLAGLEILRQMAEADRQRAACMRSAEQWSGGRKRILKAEQSQLDAILDADRKTYTLDDALGLMDPSKRSKRVDPKQRKVRCATATIPKILKSLDDLVHAHREETIRYERWGDECEELLGEVDYGFPSSEWEEPAKGQIKKLPLHEIWEEWYRGRPAALKDKDSLELLRIIAVRSYVGGWRYDGLKQWIDGREGMGGLLCPVKRLPKLRYVTIVGEVVEWLFVVHPPKGAVDYLLDVIETICSLIPECDLQTLVKRREAHANDSNDDWRNLDADFRDVGLVTPWISLLRRIFLLPSTKSNKKQRDRCWQLLRWLDEPVDGALRQHPDFDAVVQHYYEGRATLTDIADHLLGPRSDSSFDSLGSVTDRDQQKSYSEFFEIEEIDTLVSRCVDRVLEIELARGEAATIATFPALAISTFRGVELLTKFLTALGKEGFKVLRGYSANVAGSKPATLIAMVKNTWPAEGDTPEHFTKAMRQAIKDGHFPQERLLQLAFLAPQWREFVESTLKWDGFTEAIYWYAAHMRYVWGLEQAFEDDVDADREGTGEDDTDDSAEGVEKLSRWQRIIRERTPLTDEERDNGAIDVAWFHRVYEQLTPKRWQALAATAKFAASAAQVKRASSLATCCSARPRRKTSSLEFARRT